MIIRLISMLDFYSNPTVAIEMPTCTRIHFQILTCSAALFFCLCPSFSLPYAVQSLCFDIQQNKSPNAVISLIPLLKALASDPVHFYINLESMCQFLPKPKQKALAELLIGIAFNLTVILERIDICTVFNLKIHEHRTFFTYLHHQLLCVVVFCIFY